MRGYAFLCFAITLLVLYAGGFTTTIGAGMVFPDWPLSNGSLNPPGWTTDEAMRAEHGHRLLAGTVGLLCIGLVVWTQLAEPRAWVRKLAIAALSLVIFQGLLGGMRVLLVKVDLAAVHGVTAQIFLCVLATVAVSQARWWQALPSSELPSLAAWRRLRPLGLALVLLTITQLTVGSIVRHAGVGMAIPYFPQAAADGSLWPTSLNWATGTNLLHRGLALIIFILAHLWAWRVFRLHAATPAMRLWAGAALVLVYAQVLLGASIIWTTRAPIQTTLHVLNGALFLSTTWVSVLPMLRPLALVSSPARQQNTPSPTFGPSPAQS